MATTTSQQDTALFVAAFFDELTRWGVRDVVVSPGSRSTALAMAAFELSCRRPDALRVFVDIDERGASFLGLGMAKASGRPVALVCTSGTALANYYPAVIEAETSRVPLIVLSGDRPPQLQGLGAPQTTDQLKAYSSHVRAFRAMPLPGGRDSDIAFARQAAREACLAALGPAATLVPGASDEPAPVTGNPEADAYLASLDAVALNYDPNLQVASRASSCTLAGPVHLNFPFEAPLKPDFEGADVQAALQRAARDCFEVGARILPAPRRKGADGARCSMPPPRCRRSVRCWGPRASWRRPPWPSLERLLWHKRPDAGAGGRGRLRHLGRGRGDSSPGRARRRLPASGRPALRPAHGGRPAGHRQLRQPLPPRPPAPAPEVVIRFGRYPVSKSATALLGKACAPFRIVVDVAETRDFNAVHGLVRGHHAPRLRAQPLAHRGPQGAARASPKNGWPLNDEARLPHSRRRARDGAATHDSEAMEGAFVRTLLELIPEGSCLFSANSMSHPRAWTRST